MMARHRPSILVGTALAAALWGVAPLLLAQQATGDLNPSFEVASVKHNKSGDTGVRILFQPGGRFTAENITLQFLISAAYGDPRPLADFQIVGGPKWITSDRFDVIAKAEGDLQPSPSGVPT